MSSATHGKQFIWSTTRCVCSDTIMLRNTGHCSYRRNNSPIMHCIMVIHHLWQSYNLAPLDFHLFLLLTDQIKGSFSKKAEKEQGYFMVYMAMGVLKFQIIVWKSSKLVELIEGSFLMVAVPKGFIGLFDSKYNSCPPTYLSFHTYRNEVDTQHCNFACCFVGVWNFASQVK